MSADASTSSSRAAPLRAIRLLLCSDRRSRVLSIGALFLTLTAWAFVSPMGSSPDDAYHLSSIMCGGLKGESVCEPVSEGVVRVPRAATSAACFAFDPTVSGACQVPRYTAEAQELVVTESYNTGFYPPVFYGVNSLFASSDAYFTSAIVRLANLVVYVVLLVASLAVAPVSLRKTLIATHAVVLAPLALFIIPSTNPSSWAFTSVSLFWFVLVAHLSPANNRLPMTSALLILLAAVGGGARSDSAVWLVISALLVIVLGPDRRRLVRADALTAVIVMLVLLLSIASSGQDEMGRGGLDKVREVSAVDLHFANIGEVVRIALGAVGPSPLGWLDTPMSSWTTVLGPSVLLAFVSLALVGRTLRAQFAMLLGAAVMIGTPMYMLWQGNYIVGEAIQARYFMPMLVAVIGIAAVPVGGFSMLFSRAHQVAFTLVLTVSQALALHTHIRRYSSGLDVGGLNLDRGLEWWFTSIPFAQPMAVWAASSLLFALFVWNALTPLVREPSLASRSFSEAPNP